MTSKKPYLLRALYEWISDNQKTPYLMIDATFPGIQVPKDYVQDGRIVLDVAEKAVQDLVINNSFICFVARFEHDQVEIKVPVSSILAIFAQEDGDGMTFTINEEDRMAALTLPLEEFDLTEDSDDEQGGGSSGNGKPHLSIVE